MENKICELKRLIENYDRNYKLIEEIFKFIKDNDIVIDDDIAKTIWWHLRNFMFIYDYIVMDYLDIYVKIVEKYPVLDNDYHYKNNLKAIRTKFTKNSIDKKYLFLLLIKDEEKLLKYFDNTSSVGIIGFMHNQLKYNIDRNIEIKIFDSLFETFSIDSIIHIINYISTNSKSIETEYCRKFLKHIIDSYIDKKEHKINSDLYTKLLDIIFVLETERKNTFLKFANNKVKYELFKDDLYIPKDYEEILELAKYSIENKQRNFLELILDKNLRKKIIETSLIEEFLENRGNFGTIMIDNFIERFDITVNVVENIIKLFQQTKNQPIYTNLIPNILCKYIENTVTKYNEQALKNNYDNEEEKFIELIFDIFDGESNLNKLCNNYGIINIKQFKNISDLLYTNYNNTKYEYFGIIFAIINNYFDFEYNLEKQEISFDFDIYTIKEKNKNLKYFGLFKHENGKNYIEKIDDFKYQENETKEEKINNEIYAEVGENIENFIENEIIQTRFYNKDIKVTKIGSVSKDLRIMIEENVDLTLFNNSLQSLNEALKEEYQNSFIGTKSFFDF